MATEPLSPSIPLLERGTWLRPMLWILAAPLATLPLTAVLMNSILGTSACDQSQVGGSSCQTGPVLIALAPGLVNLVPVIWLWSQNARMRLAAITATILGALRFAFPAVALVATAGNSGFGAATSCSGGCSYIVGGWFVPNFPGNGTYQVGPEGDYIVANFDIVAISLLLWLLTLIVMFALVRAMRSRPLVAGK